MRLRLLGRPPRPKGFRAARFTIGGELAEDEGGGQLDGGGSEGGDCSDDPLR